MKTKIRINKTIIFSLILFYIISIISLYSTLDYMSVSNNILNKQIGFYIIGFFIMSIIFFIKTENLIKYGFYIYLANIFLLIYVLIFGSYINGSRAWIQIPIIGNIQPSEFMKIGLILFLAKILSDNIKRGSSDLIIILKSIVIFLIPTIFTFLEPDTGAVINFFVITIAMLFISGIKKDGFSSFLSAYF